MISFFSFISITIRFLFLYYSGRSPSKFPLLIFYTDAYFSGFVSEKNTANRAARATLVGNLETIPSLKAVRRNLKGVAEEYVKQTAKVSARTRCLLTINNAQVVCFT